MSTRIIKLDMPAVIDGLREAERREAISNEHDELWDVTKSLSLSPHYNGRRDVVDFINRNTKGGE